MASKFSTPASPLLSLPKQCVKRRGVRGKTPQCHLTGGVSTWLQGLVGSRWTAAFYLLAWLDAAEVLLLQTSNHGSHLPLVESISISGELDITLSLSVSQPCAMS